ncbi:unnamed protein product [Heterobilharzia americana]|nr:unnamed protein product [Heterobilharzia americana]
MTTTTTINSEFEGIWTLWSGGFQIDHAHSFTSMLRLNYFRQVDLPQSLFFRVVVTLKSATFLYKLKILIVYLHFVLKILVEYLFTIVN